MPSLKSLSQEKLRFCSMNWITKGRFRQENLGLVWRWKGKKFDTSICYVLFMRWWWGRPTIIISLWNSVCLWVWADFGSHVNSDWALLALQSLLCWEGRCQIAQSQIKSIESEKIVAALLSLSPFMNSMHLNQGDLINATIQGVWKQWRLQK